MFRDAALVLVNPYRSAILVLQMPAEDKSRAPQRILTAMDRGEDVWDEFLELAGRFILHVLINDYAFFDDYSDHDRQEILHDIYLKVKRNAFRFSGGVNMQAYRGYLRKTIRSVMADRLRNLLRLKRNATIDTLDDHSESLPDRTQSDPLKRLEAHWRERATHSAVHGAILQVSQGAQNSRQVRRVLQGRLLKGNSYKDIAATCGLSVDSARHIVHYYKGRVLDEIRKRLTCVMPEGEVHGQR